MQALEPAGLAICEDANLMRASQGEPVAPWPEIRIGQCVTCESGKTDFLDAIRKSGITNARLGFASVINAVGQ